MKACATLMKCVSFLRADPQNNERILPGDSTWRSNSRTSNLFSPYPTLLERNFPQLLLTQPALSAPFPFHSQTKLTIWPDFQNELKLILHMTKNGILDPPHCSETSCPCCKLKTWFQCRPQTVLQNSNCKSDPLYNSTPIIFTLFTDDWEETAGKAQYLTKKKKFKFFSFADRINHASVYSIQHYKW